MLKIGKVQLATPLLLAPIAGYCDLSFRLIARRCGGVGLACTDLLCPEGVLRENYRSMVLSMTCEEDTPLCMQLYGANPDRLCEAARWVEDHGANVVDINMGCPVDKVTKKDGGSKLLCDPDSTVRMVERVVGVLRHTPLTAKLRLGWDDTCIVAPQLARRLEEVGVQLITIHGRTTEMRFSGKARLDGIAQVVAAVKNIPVIGNGDVRSAADAKRMIDVTGCAGVMVGRAALSNPWIFRETDQFLREGTLPPPPTLAEKCQLMRDHFANIVRFRGERIALLEFRQRVSWYAKNLHPCRILRDPMRQVRTAAEFHGIIDRFEEWRVDYDAQVAAGRIRPLAEAVPDELVAG